MRQAGACGQRRAYTLLSVARSALATRNGASSSFSVMSAGRAAGPAQERARRPVASGRATPGAAHGRERMTETTHPLDHLDQAAIGLDGKDWS
jgi:hypothetical protein